MATTAAFSSADRASAKAPISAHPAFPAIVALWFAALLGLGSLVLPVALLERLVSVTGISSLIASAAPPLGFTARVAIALAGGTAGALIGLALARQVARAHAPEPRPRYVKTVEAQPRRPISAHDELGEEGLDTSEADRPLLAQKRRSLAMSEDNRRSTYLQPEVPLPGQADGAASAPPLGQSLDAEPEPLELAEFADIAGDAPDELPSLEPDPALEALRSQIHVSDDPIQDQPMSDRRTFDQPFESDEDSSCLFDEEYGDEGGDRVPQSFEPAPDAADPLPFAAPSLRRASAPVFEESDENFEEYEEDDEVSEVAAPEEFAVHLSLIDNSEEPESVDDDRPLDELGLVQLAARLGASIRRRKERQAAAAVVPSPREAAPLADIEDFEVAEADDAARAMADFFGSAAAESVVEAEEAVPEAEAVPASLQAANQDLDDEAEDEALVASLSLPLSRTTAQTAAFIGDEERDADEEEADTEYSSLLAMKNPFAREQEFVRVEEPEDDADGIEPAVTFPSVAPRQWPSPVTDQAAGSGARPFDPPGKAPESAASVVTRGAPQDAGDAERSLRQALATLQRMSGAA